MFKFVAVLAATVAVASGTYTQSDKDFLFSAFKTQFGKEYATPEEHSLRQAIFANNLERISAHNAKNLGWTMALNEFADLTSTEFSIGRIGGFVPRSLRVRSNIADIEGVEAPASVDWTSKNGIVTPVKNQGQCGSCWAFSTTGSTESINAINGHGLVSLSEQELVDCSGSYGNQGCNGGLMDDAFKYIIANGICTEASYPYKAADGMCDKSCTPAVHLTGYTDVPSDNDNAFKTAIAQQPVSIAIEADQSSFQFYSGGVMSGSCGARLDHGVLAVGYGTEGGKSFWKVKNSWGAGWGMSGYILLDGTPSLNGGSGQCGLMSQPSWPSQ